jgi:hypothetical protein
MIHYGNQTSSHGGVGNQVHAGTGYSQTGLYSSPTGENAHPLKRRLTVGENSQNGLDSMPQSNRKRSMTAPSPSIAPRIVEPIGAGSIGDQALGSYQFPPTGVYGQTNPPLTSGLNAYDPMLSMSAHFDGTSPRIPVNTIQEPTQAATTAEGLTSIVVSSAVAGGKHPAVSESDTDYDPFLGLLEQLVEKEQSRGSTSDIDFFFNNS